MNTNRIATANAEVTALHTTHWTYLADIAAAGTFVRRVAIVARALRVSIAAAHAAVIALETAAPEVYRPTHPLSIAA
ncbi:hypothetical protein [Aeromicrobium sp. Leaf291]|uniref:hypothetical protein n=1 Tax=Aeromicrobium sp. Leaf291 TaxID=1736325 RepID=UPI0006FF2A0A|nr:hypothetical protein [Aeromicrobium sp. Leaf291]KQP81587.1 hypothetical protein ASF35_16280 [Aeromicrobium sp. Leaf291]